MPVIKSSISWWSQMKFHCHCEQSAAIQTLDRHVAALLAMTGLVHVIHRDDGIGSCHPSRWRDWFMPSIAMTGLVHAIHRSDVFKGSLHDSVFALLAIFHFRKKS
jgi:hypothetical protein